MAPELSRLIRQVTFGLLLLASAAVEVAAVEDRSLATSLGLALLWALLAAGLGWLLPRPSSPSAVPPRFVLLLLFGLGSAPFLMEFPHREWLGDGYPLELQMVFALRNLGLGLAACASWALCLRLACAVSLFLMLFVVSMTDHPAVLVLLGLYSAVGSTWLMLVYWTGLRRFFVAPETAVTVEVQPERERLPWAPILIVVGLVSCVLALVLAGPQRTARALGEWLPTSGGTGDYDTFARGGVNDGEDEVRGENAKSTGMTQTDTFLDSPLPSLYDMINDRYGEPFKPKEREQAIALGAQEKANESKKRAADNLRPNREFSTSRKGPREARAASDRAARALFEVQGRTPLHLRVTTFDAFDGRTWQEAPLRQALLLIEKEPGGCWMKVRGRTAEIFAESEPHKFKITSSSGGSWLPGPPHLTRFRVGRVDQPAFFTWGQDRILRLARRKVPSGIVVETECRTVDPRLLGAANFAGGARGRSPTAPGPHPEVVALVKRWVDGQPKDWPQIAAVLEHLRTECALDPAARVPEDCRDPLGHFLLQSRRGPDYQFATAAAILLRVLGYNTRLVSGFYVAPVDYDPLSQHTPVVPEDLHFWAEVMLPSGDWLVIEATPGYEVLEPSLSLSQRLGNALLAVASWAWRHAIGLGLSAVVCAGLWWRRREVLDFCAVTVWRWFPGRTWQQCVRRALWLLEWRGRWAGRPRRDSQTVPTWLRSALAGPTSPGAELERLTQMAEWAAYAPELGGLAPWQADEARSVCRQVLDAWTFQRIQSKDEG